MPSTSTSPTPKPTSGAARHDVYNTAHDILSEDLGERFPNQALSQELIEVLIGLGVELLSSCFTLGSAHAARPANIISRAKNPSLRERVILQRAVRERLFGGSTLAYLRGNGSKYRDALLSTANQMSHEELEQLILDGADDEVLVKDEPSPPEGFNYSPI